MFSNLPLPSVPPGQVGKRLLQKTNLSDKLVSRLWCVPGGNYLSERVRVLYLPQSGSCVLSLFHLSDGRAEVERGAIAFEDHFWRSLFIQRLRHRLTLGLPLDLAVKLSWPLPPVSLSV